MSAEIIAKLIKQEIITVDSNNVIFKENNNINRNRGGIFKIEDEDKFC